MIATIIIVGLALAWLGHETKWLTIRLAYGETSPIVPNTTIETLPSPQPVLLIAAPKKPTFERMLCYKHKGVTTWAEIVRQ